MKLIRTSVIENNCCDKHAIGIPYFIIANEWVFAPKNGYKKVGDPHFHCLNAVIELWGKKVVKLLLAIADDPSNGSSFREI